MKEELQEPTGTVSMVEAAKFQNAIEASEALYKDWGYTRVHTPMLDYFDPHKRFFNKEDEQGLYRLIDRDGRLLVLRSDITIFLLKQIFHVLKTKRHKKSAKPIRLSYNDSILRYEGSSSEYYQSGVELIGTRADREKNDSEILCLLCENLKIVGVESPAVHIGSRKIFEHFCAELFPAKNAETIAENIRLHDWEALDNEGCAQFFSSIQEVVEGKDNVQPLTGIVARVFAQSPERAAQVQSELSYIHRLAETLKQKYPHYSIRIDPSEIARHKYYSGITFQVYAANIPRALACGGAYDSLLEEFSTEYSARGYSIMLSALNTPAHALAHSQPLRFAIPKGRLLDNILHWFSESGLSINIGKRQLHIQDSNGRIELLLAKNADIPTYLYYGIAGLGICGSDLLYEADLPFVKLKKFAFGATRMCLAGAKEIAEASENESAEGAYTYNERIRVATSYTRAARNYFHRQNIPVDVIKLSGSVELAVLCGLAPYIVDLVESGETLRANKLEILEEIKQISVYLVANTAYFKYNYFNIQEFLKNSA